MASNWYMSLYYKYRDYPVSQINNKYKRNELKNVYANIFNRFSQYFYINLSEQDIQSTAPASSNKIISQKKSLNKFNSGVSLSGNSKADLLLGVPSHMRNQKRNDARLFSQLTDKILNSCSDIDMMEKQFPQSSAKGIKNLLSLITNTSKELINNLIIQSSNDHKQSSYEIPGEDNSSISLNQTEKTDQIEYEADHSNVQIIIENLPSNNQEANYYFIEFCSKVEIAQQTIASSIQNNQTFKSIKTQNNIPSQSNLKQIIKKQKKQNIDQTLLQVFKRQFNFANTLLSRFFEQTSSHGETNHKNYEMNIILQTWLEMIIMTQNQTVLYEVVQQLVKDTGNKFTQKISSYLHFICLANSKSLLVSSVSKYNFLHFIPEFLSGNRSLSDFNLQKSDNVIMIYDKTMERSLYNRQALDEALQKWGHIGRIVTQLLIKNEKIFWAKIFESCCSLFDQYLEQKVQFSYSLVLLYEKLGDQNTYTVLNLPEWKKSYYQKSLKVILQRQVGYSPFQMTTIKSEIKSKVSIADGASSKTHRNPSDSGFLQESASFTFYDTKTAENQSKIFELKQWERVVKQSIIRLKGYKKILDIGLQLFKGISECVVIFFLQSYFNFQKTEVVTQIDFMAAVNKYCANLNQTTISKKAQNSQNSQQRSSQQQQTQIHRHNYKYISKTMQAQFKMQQILFKQTQIANITNESNKEDQQRISIHQENNLSNYNHNFDHFNELKILEEDYIQNMYQKVNEENHSMNGNLTTSAVIEEINNYLKLVNQCNFIFSTIQQNDVHVCLRKNKINEALQEIDKPPSKAKRLVILDSRELVYSLAKLSLEQEQQSKRIMMQTQHQAHRKTSNIGRAIRTSAINGYLTLGKDKSWNFDKSHDMDYEKMIDRVKEHSRCLELMISLYYKSSQYFKQVSRRINCQNCFGQFAFEDSMKDKGNQNTQAGTEFTRYRQMAANSLMQCVHRYQELHKNLSRNRLIEFEKEIKEEIELNSLNNQILQIFTFMASLHTSHSTFLAIYKQDLLSQQKLQRVKVIGKPYYQAIHNLFTQNMKCGDFFSSISFEDRKNLYLSNLMVIIVSLIELVYESSEECLDLAPYTSLLMSYFVSKTYHVSNIQKSKINDELVNLSKIMLQCFDWNEQNLPQISLKQFILRLLELRTTPQSEMIVPKLKTYMEAEFQILNKYETYGAKVEYLKKKLLYLMLREVYFDCYYDIGVFEFKSLQARKNFQIYEAKMKSFFEEIIRKDEEQYLQKQSEELKQRSAHLKGFLIDYQKQPKFQSEERDCIIKIVCIFNKTLNIITENRQTEMKKRGSNSISVLRKNRRKHDPIYIFYVSNEFIKPDNERVKVFENDEYNFFRAIQIYEDMLCKRIESSQKKYSIYKENGSANPRSIYIGFTQNDLELVQKCRQSLISLWVNFEYKILHENKMVLTRQNFLSTIEKLYIDLDVRHKVFESFKDKILNYQMQKTKIYHQYMDYIRGLKLDVYSHVNGEDPFPYFKLINAIKKYRLGIKRLELDQKVNEEFGKNLGKWNDGIANDIKQYNNWILQEMKYWKVMNESSSKSKKQLFEIYNIVSKQLKRQNNKNVQNVITTKNTSMRATRSSINFRKSVHKNKNTFK